MTNLASDTLIDQLDQERSARREAEAASQRFAFLAQAGAVLTASLDYRTTLGDLARLTVPAMADVCAVFLLQPDGSLVRAVIATIEADPFDAFSQPPEPIPLDPDAVTGLWSVVRDCRSELYTSIPEGLLERHAATEATRDRYRRAGVASAILVPVQTHGVAFGAISFLSCNPARTFTEKDQVIAEEIGRLCAVAIEHSTLYADAQREIEERRAAEERLRVQSRRQAMVAELGHLALTDRGVPVFLQAAVEALARTLTLDLVLVTELNAQQDALTLVAELGHDQAIGTVGSVAESAALAQYTLAVGGTVLVDDLRGETRFVPSERLLRTGAISALCAPVVGGGRTLGLLYGMSGSAVRFGADDRNFIESVAHMVAGAWLRAHAAAALMAEKERLAVTLGSIGDGVIATDIEARVVLVNAVAEAMTGWPEADAIGEPIGAVLRLVHGRTGAPVDDPVMRALGSNTVVASGEHHRIRSRDGSECVVTRTAAPIRGAGGQVLGVVLVLRDETEKARIDAELQRAGTLESLGLFAGGIAHDFNNILTGILANLSLVRAQVAPDARVQPRLAAAELASIRARELAQQLLTFAKGGTPIRRSASIEDIVRESASFAGGACPERCRFDVQAGLRRVEVDPVQIGQVVQNLVINALQAMSGQGHVDLVLRNIDLVDPVLPLPPGPYVCLQVVDAGAGILPEHLPRVFLPFFTTRRRGTGLGLATAYSIVKKHDGHIMVESTPGTGTCFSVYLPAAGEAQAAAPAGSHPSRLSRGGGRVLVMDDEALVRETLTLLLQALGCEVTAPVDGNQAIDAWRLALAEGNPYACVVMDLTVPGGMGGLAALRGILGLDPTARAIVSSGYSEDPVMSDCVAYGFTDVLAKPYTLGELSAVLGRVVPLARSPA